VHNSPHGNQCDRERQCDLLDGAIFVLVLVVLTALIWERFREPLNLFTGVLALATVALVYVSGLQWRTLDKTDETWRAGERAYVFPAHNVAGWQAGQIKNGVIYRSFPAVWENSGTSPTRDLVAALYCPEVQSLPERNPIKLLNKPSATFTLLPGPKQTTWSGACDIAAPNLKLVRDNGYHLYIAATANYFDIFDEHHHTETCFEIGDITGDLDDIKATPQFAYRNCGRNCADKECNR
jgi:hypothetical protein